MEGSSSSKVTVQYHDPSRLFQILSSELRARLPLRNLHWKSVNRPLRSIESLHVDLVLASAPRYSGQNSGGDQHHINQSKATQQEELIAATEWVKPGSGERRHQIPGLRQTPYLKVFLLRCDDKETYKETAKEQLKDWLKENTALPTNAVGNIQDRHDAFEWLIVHVVLPDTAAAAQPRWRNASRESTGGPVERNRSGARWPGRGSRTILDKLRKNFNVSGKTEPDRVAQIRLPKAKVPPELLPVAAPIVSSTYNESPEEQENAWLDLIAKVKTLILRSFDLRVRQYEEDIREKSLQRSLPGWNFCTFFLLKEGLAKAFESVGLLEDALAGYDELGADFSEFIRSRSLGGDSMQEGLLGTHSEDLQLRLRELQDSVRVQRVSTESDGGVPPDTNLSQGRPLDERNKAYAELILSNSISVFDLKCYLFARQLTLLLRLSNISGPQGERNGNGQRPRSSSLPNVNEASQTTIPTEKLKYLADCCQRALAFATLVPRIMREDLRKGYEHGMSSTMAKSVVVEDRLPPEPSSAVKELIDCLVQSWTFDTVQQVLDATNVLSHDQTPQALPQGHSVRLGARRSGSSPSMSRGYPGSNIAPRIRRIKSTSTSKYDTKESSMRNGSVVPQVVYENERFSNSEPEQSHLVASAGQTGRLDLAGHRAELLLLERRVLTKVGRSRGWLIGWAAPQVAQINDRANSREVAVGAEGNHSLKGGEGRISQPRGPSPMSYSNGVLRSVSTSIEAYRRSYEELSDSALQHLLAAERTNSAEAVMKDLAVLKFERQDYATAAAYFGRTATSSSNERWNDVEAAMLKLHARCLKHLNRKDEYVTVLLTLLSKKTAMERGRITTRSSRASRREDSAGGNANDVLAWLDDDDIGLNNYLSELVSYSSELTHDVHVELTTCFSDVEADPYIRHFLDQDGFQIGINIRHLLENVLVERVRARLVSIQDRDQVVWLESDAPLQLQTGMNRIWLSSKTSTLGYYLLDKVIVEAGRVSFVQEFSHAPGISTTRELASRAPHETRRGGKEWRVLCYSRVGALQAALTESACIDLGQSRTFDVHVRTYANDIDWGEMHLRSATAGLRLRTENIKVLRGDLKISDTSQPGIIKFREMCSGSMSTLQIPYDLGSDISRLTVSLEVRYHTHRGVFTFLSFENIDAGLPLDVKIDDKFREDYVLTKFSIRTNNSSPFRILNVDLEETDIFHISPADDQKRAQLVYRDQVASFSYKISRNKPEAAIIKHEDAPPSRSLRLTVTFRSVKEELRNAIESAFRTALDNSEFTDLITLLVPRMRSEVSDRLLPVDFEVIGRSGKIDKSVYSRLDCEAFILGLPDVRRARLIQWWTEWRDSKAPLMYQTSTPEEEYEQQKQPATHRMTVHFEVREVPVLHTVSLDFLDQQGGFAGSAPVAVGQPLAVHFRIKHTRKWGSTDSANCRGQDQPLCFVLDIRADSNAWLVGGQRRVHFSARENELLAFPVVLVPLKQGTLSLPSVEVKAQLATSPSSEEGSQSLPAAAAVDAMEVPSDSQQPIWKTSEASCETDYLNEADKLQVIPNFRTTTVSLRFEAPEWSRARLLDAEPRTQISDG